MTHIKWPNELGPSVPRGPEWQKPMQHEANWQGEAMRLSALLHSAMLGEAKAEAKLALAIEALRKVVPYWDKINPLRSADMHRSECDCYRCDFDYARAALAELEKTE